MTFVVDIVFVKIVDTPSIMLIISSQTITESSTILIKYLLFSHVLGFQLSYWHVQYIFHSHWHLSLLHLWFEIHVAHYQFCTYNHIKYVVLTKLLTYGNLLSTSPIFALWAAVVTTPLPSGIFLSTSPIFCIKNSSSH